MKITQWPFVRKWIGHAARPGASAAGRFMLWGMNVGHAPVYEFGLSHVELPRRGKILDAGCGGGELLRRMAERVPEAKLAGVDISAASVEAARKRNRKAIAAGRMEVVEGSVEALPWPDATFDLVTACETVYFWEDPAKAFREIARVLKPGGAFAVFLETADPEGARIWTDALPAMHVRTVEELSALLSAAGFAPPAVHRKGDAANAWTCLVARRAAAQRK